MGALVNLWSQVRKQLRLVNGGTGNTQGLALGVIKVCTNRTGSTIVVNTLVKLAGTFNDARITPTTTATDKALGVVIGYWTTDDPDTLVLGDAPDAHSVAVLTHGTGRVLISATVTRGQYAFPTTTSGQAASSATVANGAFGVFQSSGTAGNTALVTLTGTQGAGVGSATTFGTPAIVLGTAAAPGVATTAVRTDATIVAFDATTPATSPLGGAGAVGVVALAARRDHVHPITGALDALSDVTAPTPATGDNLAWSGSAWVNQSPGADPNIWRPVMGYNGTGYEVIVDAGSGGTALMGYGPT